MGFASMFFNFWRVSFTDNCTVPSSEARKTTVDIWGRPVGPTVANVAYGAFNRSLCVCGTVVNDTMSPPWSNRLR
jgi:hypothetical protein